MFRLVIQWCGVGYRNFRNHSHHRLGYEMDEFVMQLIDGGEIFTFLYILGIGIPETVSFVLYCGLVVRCDDIICTCTIQFNIIESTLCFLKKREKKPSSFFFGF